MPETTIIVEKAENRPRHTPARALAVFLMGFVTVTVMALIQHWQRAELEFTDAPTALGDRAYFEPTDGPVTRSVGKLDGASLYLASEEPVTMKDEVMMKVAWVRKYHLYAEGSEQSYFVKISEGEYLPLTAERP